MTTASSDYSTDDLRSTLFRCHFCGEPVDPNAENIYRRVTGWVRNRKRGVNAVALPGPTTGYACWVCIDIESGKNPQAQMDSLF